MKVCTDCGINAPRIEEEDLCLDCAVKKGVEFVLKSGMPRLDTSAKVVTYYAPVKTGRNEQCPCGSNKKYKKCCL